MDRKQKQYDINRMGLQQLTDVSDYFKKVFRSIDLCFLSLGERFLFLDTCSCIARIKR